MRKSAIIFSLLFSVATSSAAQDVPTIRSLNRWTNSIHEQVRQVEMEYGLTIPTHELYASSLQKDGKQLLAVRLEANTRYVVVGMCDEDCDDLDLELFQRNRLVGRDVEDDALPVIQIRGLPSGMYQLRVTMADCKKGPCTYGVAIYKR